MSNTYQAPKQHAIPTLFLRVSLLLVMMASILPAPLQAQAAKPSAPVSALAPTNIITLEVKSARTETRALNGAGVIKGDPILTYQYIINVDNSGDPFQSRTPDCYPRVGDATGPVNPAYPDNCNWPSLVAQPGYAPVADQGTEINLNGTTSLSLPDGNYLISVLADGYKIDGVHFTLPAQTENGIPSLLTVEMQPLPLPSATIRIKVFNDNASTNGQPDIPSEEGIAGFFAVVNDIAGQVSTDVFGNPLCTVYQKTDGVNVDLDVNGDPIIVQMGAGCVSDANGDIVIPNLGPNRYAVSVTMPTNDQNWIQTTTLEGNKDWDTWVQEGYTGFRQ